MISHSARSMALMALMVTAPPVQVTLRCSEVQICSIWKGSFVNGGGYEAGNTTVCPDALLVVSPSLSFGFCGKIVVVRSLLTHF